MTQRHLDSAASGRGMRSAGDALPAGRFTAADGYRTVTSLLMVVLGVVILVRTLAFGFHLTAVAVGLGFMALGGYRLSFVFAYLRRARSR